MPRKNEESKLGQSTNYLPSVARKICRFVERGCTGQVAASVAGIPASTFDQWQDDYPEFSWSIKRAEAKCQALLLSAINRAASEGQWRAAAWLLEHRWPEEFGKRGQYVIPAHSPAEGEGRPPREEYIHAISRALGVTRKPEPTGGSDVGNNGAGDNGGKGAQVLLMVNRKKRLL